MKLEDENAKLMRQLQLEDYHERKVLTSLQNLREKRMMEEAVKRENDIIVLKKIII